MRSRARSAVERRRDDIGLIQLRAGRGLVGSGPGTGEARPRRPAPLQRLQDGARTQHVRLRHAQHIVDAAPVRRGHRGVQLHERLPRLRIIPIDQFDPNVVLTAIPTVLAETEKLMRGETALAQWRRKVYREVEPIIAR